MHDEILKNRKKRSPKKIKKKKNSCPLSLQTLLEQPPWQGTKLKSLTRFSSLILSKAMSIHPFNLPSSLRLKASPSPSSTPTSSTNRWPRPLPKWAQISSPASANRASTSATWPCPMGFPLGSTARSTTNSSCPLCCMSSRPMQKRSLAKLYGPEKMFTVWLLTLTLCGHQSLLRSLGCIISRFGLNLLWCSHYITIWTSSLSMVIFNAMVKDTNASWKIISFLFFFFLPPLQNVTQIVNILLNSLIRLSRGHYRLHSRRQSDKSEGYDVVSPRNWYNISVSPNNFQFVSGH